MRHAGPVPHGIVWFRRDLRLDDHAALAAALARCRTVTCAFVLDEPLLRGPQCGAPIVQFFFDALAELRAALRARGSDLALLAGEPAAELGALAQRLDARALFFNADVEPVARARDDRVSAALADAGIAVASFDDQVYAPAGAVLQASGKPYSVFTPYRRRWDELPLLAPYPGAAALRGKLAKATTIGPTRVVPRPEDYGHAASPLYPRAGMREAHRLLAAFLADGIAAYTERRDLPARDGTSRLSPHLRAGTIGIRTCVAAARQAGGHGAATWLAELAWRDFYAQILVHHPRVARGPFVAAAERIAYRDDPAGWEAWCTGRTGYPIVDAGMRQLNATGWMHNRLRMIVASFLTKHLLIDYRAGERYFEQHLADADLAANNGGWQWSASTGTDAAPYFSVFNPTLQAQRFDPDGAFVRRWIPELDSGYPPPIVDHAFARARALAVYGAALGRPAATS